MKSIGIVRKIDKLRRIFVPIEIRRILDIKTNDPMEIFVDGECIILRKYSPQCYLCGRIDDLKYFKGKNVCQQCILNS
jgi:transcriptional pleiotropic regulator of transition state genes